MEDEPFHWDGLAGTEMLLITSCAGLYLKYLNLNSLSGQPTLLNLQKATVCWYLWTIRKPLSPRKTKIVLKVIVLSVLRFPCPLWYFFQCVFTIKHKMRYSYLENCHGDVLRVVKKEANKIELSPTLAKRRFEEVLYCLASVDWKVCPRIIAGIKLMLQNHVYVRKGNDFPSYPLKADDRITEVDILWGFWNWVILERSSLLHL